MVFSSVKTLFLGYKLSEPHEIYGLFFRSRVLYTTQRTHLMEPLSVRNSEYFLILIIKEISDALGCIKLFYVYIFFLLKEAFYKLNFSNLKYIIETNAKKKKLKKNQRSAYFHNIYISYIIHCIQVK